MILLKKTFTLCLCYLFTVIIFPFPSIKSCLRRRKGLRVPRSFIFAKFVFCSFFFFSCTVFFFKTTSFTLLKFVFLFLSLSPCWACTMHRGWVQMLFSQLRVRMFSKHRNFFEKNAMKILLLGDEVDDISQFGTRTPICRRRLCLDVWKKICYCERDVTWCTKQ